MPPSHPDARPTDLAPHAGGKLAGDSPDAWMFHQLPLPAWVFDEETLRFLEVNDAAVRQYGWTREEFLGMTVVDIRPPETVWRLRQALAMQRGRHSVVSFHRTREGRNLTVEVSSQPVIAGGRAARLVIVQDRTEFERVQRDAQASEESYRALVSQLTDVFFRTDPAGRWTLLTPSWEQLTGKRVEESLGQTCLECIDPHDHDRVFDVLPTLVSGRVPEAALHLRLLTADGGFRWVEARARRVVGPDGTTTGMAGTLHDVTQRLEAREQARASDAQFRAVFDGAAVGMIVLALDGRVLQANLAYQSLVGYSEDELRAMSPGAYTATEDLPLEAEMLARMSRGESRVAFDKRYLRKDGRTVWGHLTLSSVPDASGAPQRVIAMIEDITARRAAEHSLTAEREFLRTLLDNLSDGILACDAHGIITVSNAMVRELGLVGHATPGSDASALGGRVFAPWKKEPLSPEERPLARALRGEIVRGEELVVVPRGGRARTLLASALSFSNGDGELMGAVLALHDITDRKAAEVALRAARDEAEEARKRAEDARRSADEASRTKSDFLARMSHELRTPLNSIIGFANVLQRSRPANLSDGDLRYLSRISANGRHLLEIINDLLDLTRVEAGRMPIVLEPVVLQEVVADAVGVFEPQLRDRPVKMVTEIPAHAHRVQADPARLRQVLVNLIGNAVKFTERGEVRVRLVLDEGHVPVRIEVEDTGIGIAPERTAAIFEAFEQAESTTTRRFGGTGLGLAISRSLSELMGFTLEVRSVLGAGTLMTVQLQPAETAAR